MDEIILKNTDGKRIMIKATDITNIEELEYGNCRVNTALSEFEVAISFDRIVNIYRKTMELVNKSEGIYKFN